MRREPPPVTLRLLATVKSPVTVRDADGEILDDKIVTSEVIFHMTIVLRTVYGFGFNALLG